MRQVKLREREIERSRGSGISVIKRENREIKKAIERERGR